MKTSDLSAVSGAISISPRLMKVLSAGSAVDARPLEIPAMATVEMLARLPALDDDDQVGVEREHVVPRDGQANLRFRGTLLAAVAPDRDRDGRWNEYRVYYTSGGKHVFSKVGRSVLDDERDRFSAEVYDSKLYGSPRGWQGGCVDYFRYDELAKKLYHQLSIDADETIE